jgi:hypothetical protein
VRGVHKNDCPAYEPPKGDVNIGWESNFEKESRVSGLTGMKKANIKTFIRTLLLSARAEENEKVRLELANACAGQFLDGVEKGRAEEQERVVALIEGVKRENAELRTPITQWDVTLRDNYFYNRALADLLTRMRGVKE